MARRKKVISKSIRSQIILRDNGRCRACAVLATLTPCKPIISCQNPKVAPIVLTICRHYAASAIIARVRPISANYQFCQRIDGFGNFADVMAKRANFVAMVAEKRLQEIAQLYRIAQNWLR